MNDQLFTIQWVYRLKIGTVIDSGIKLKDLHDLQWHLKVGDTIKLKNSTGETFCQIKGIQYISPFSEENTQAFLLPSDVDPAFLSAGTIVIKPIS
jgi:hypothetical protein